MKKLLTTTLIFIFVSLPLTFSFAQTNDLGISLEEDMVLDDAILDPQDGTEVFYDENEDIQEETESPIIQEEDTETSEEIQVTQEQNIGFLSILFATITPALLIVIAYLLIKMSNK